MLATGLSALNAWIETSADVHFFGGVQMPFDAIFALLFLVVVFNGPLRMLQRNVSAVTRALPPFHPAELLTIYSMMLFAALISIPGTETFFLATASTLFYFVTPQNKWADTFYSLLPRHFAPGWNGKNPPTNIIQQFYSGGVTIDQVPWHAWSSMLIAWSVLLLLVYSAPFFGDMRTHMLPGFLHALKISHDLKLPRKDTCRLLLSVVCAIVVAGGVMIYTTISTNGGLTGYVWFTKDGSQAAFRGAATMIKEPPTVDPQNWFWMAVGGGLVWLMTFARARYVWFPLHPLGFIVSTGFSITRLWPSFFMDWLIKTLLLRFGGQESAARARPFMIELLLGNAVAMVLWLIAGHFLGSYMTYWPA
jgi:hypothetical protein